MNFVDIMNPPEKYLNHYFKSISLIVLFILCLITPSQYYEKVSKRLIPNFALIVYCHVHQCIICKFYIVYIYISVPISRFIGLIMALNNGS